MNIGKMKAAGVIGIIAGAILTYLGFMNFNNPASHTFWDVLNIIVGLASIIINISIAMDASKRHR